MRTEEEIIIKPNNTYLIKQANYSSYKSIFEWECIGISKTSYKFKDKINCEEFWLEKSEFKNTSFSQNGYYVLECIFDSEKRKNLIHDLSKK